MNISLNLNTNTSISFSGDFGFADMLVVSVKMSTDWETKEMPCDKNTTCKYLVFYKQLHNIFFDETHDVLVTGPTASNLFVLFIFSNVKQTAIIQ